MPSKPILVAAVALVAGGLPLGGCGSSQPASTASTRSSAASTQASSASTQSATASAPICPPAQAACVSQNPAIKPAGASDLATNLIQSMKRSNPVLSQVRLTCPPNQTHFPKVCALDGAVESQGKLVKVAGKVSAFGVDTKTHTYAYAVSYSPVR